MDEIIISVVIPVFNAAKYVTQAVESALQQPETGEVLLIEDGSPDNSLQVCRELAAESNKVMLLRHSDGKNHGAGASRNLGIRNARFEFISFLDADDYYLPGRFSVAGLIFAADPQAEGVYEAIGIHFENEAAAQRWREKNRPLLTTMPEPVPPDCLFESQLPVGKYFHCSTNGWVVRKSVFDKSGLFDEHLLIHEDTVMFAKFAAVGRMLPGRLDEPVATRRVHDHNTIFAPRSALEVYNNRIIMWSTLWEWGSKNLCKSRQRLLLWRFIHCAARTYEHKESWLARRIQSLRQLSQLVLRYPKLCSEFIFWETLWLVVLRRPLILEPEEA